MRRILMAVSAGLLALSLSACGTTGGVGTPGTGSVTDAIKQVQEYTALACKFVPTVATVAAIFSGGASSSIAAIAQDICNAVTTVPLADGPRRVPYVQTRRGKVPIKGHRI